MEKTRRPKTGLIITLCIVGALVLAAFIFTRFGGFGLGESADPAELAACAGTVEDIVIPEQVKVIALGEATHGNAEFQRLKLDVFKVMVEKYGVQGFALEGDYGGCEQANRYVHGGEGTAAEAAAAIGFAIYRTDEMAALLSYMREYNESAEPGGDLRFYGFDMQRYAYSLEFLLESCEKLGVDASALERLTDGGEWRDEYGGEVRVDALTQLRAELAAKDGSDKAVHLADVLLQNLSLAGEDAMYAELRDGYMADNIQWIAAQEAERGCERIFVSAHNGHVAKWGSNDMGRLLSDRLGEAYYVIGTDFCRTRCNMPRPDHSRTLQVFYSHDPLANAARKAGLEECWLDFSKVPEGTPLYGYITDYNYMGSLGEGFAWYMRLLPPSYRIFQPPATLYDGMIFVSDAHPTAILDE